VAVVTSDGGAHWQTVDLKEIPVSLFFLNENLGCSFLKTFPL